jgi:hypothetical protein
LALVRIIPKVERNGRVKKRKIMLS